MRVGGARIRVQVLYHIFRWTVNCLCVRPTGSDGARLLVSLLSLAGVYNYFMSYSLMSIVCI